MNLWIAKMTDLLYWLLGNPTGSVQPIVVGIAGVLAFLLFLTKVGELLGVGISSTGRSMAVLVIALGTWLPLTAAANIYIAPKLSAPLAVWMPIACGAVVTFLIAAPLTRLFQKAKYGKGLLLIILSIAGAVGVMLLVGAAFGAARQGEREGGAIKARTGEVNDFLSK